MREVELHGGHGVHGNARESMGVQGKIWEVKGVQGGCWQGAASPQVPRGSDPCDNTPGYCITGSQRRQASAVSREWPRPCAGGHRSENDGQNGRAGNAIYHGWGLGGNEIPRDGPNYTGKFQLGLPGRRCSRGGTVDRS